MIRAKTQRRPSSEKEKGIFLCVSAQPEADPSSGGVLARNPPTLKLRRIPLSLGEGGNFGWSRLVEHFIGKNLLKDIKLIKK